MHGQNTRSQKEELTGNVLAIALRHSKNKFGESSVSVNWAGAVGGVKVQDSIACSYATDDHTLCIPPF